MHPDQAHPLGAALRALPMPQPPHDGWPRLANSLARRRRPAWQRRWIPLAAAASVGLLALLMTFNGPPAPSRNDVGQPLAVSTESDADSHLTTLINQSSQLESLLDWIGTDELDAETLALDMALTDRLGWIDQLLADPDTGPATLDVLWQERVQLMRQRYALGQHALARTLTASSESLVSL